MVIVHGIYKLELFIYLLMTLIFIECFEKQMEGFKKGVDDY